MILFSRSGNSITVISKDTIIVFMTWNKKSLFFFYCCQLEMVQLRITYNFFTLMYLSCSYICTTYIPNKFAYLQSESNCKLPRIRPSWYAGPAVFKIFFFLRYAIFLARLNNFQSVSMRTFCRVLTLHYIWHFFCPAQNIQL